MIISTAYLFLVGAWVENEVVFYLTVRLINMLALGRAVRLLFRLDTQLNRLHPT